jgi:hypothetical protein
MKIEESAASIYRSRSGWLADDERAPSPRSRPDFERVDQVTPLPQRFTIMTTSVSGCDASRTRR